jgi:hypothetical protein
VASASSRQPPGERLRIELWSWSTWLVLCVISYPAVVIVWTAPRAGLLGGVAVGAGLLFAASFGYAGRRELERWLWPTVSSIASAAAVTALAYGVDGVPLGTALLCGLAVAAEIIFIWHFLPWIVRDAQPAPAPGQMTMQLLRARGRTTVRVRAALTLVLILAFLALGLGASWARGEKQVPSPTGWLIALAFVTFALMFAERLSFFERAAREGNLLMPAGCYRKWIGAGLVLLLLAAAVAAVIPLERHPEQTDDGRMGTAAADTPAAPEPQGAGLGEAVGQAVAVAREAAAVALALPPLLLALWLLLLLLLLALVLVWGFRRSRATRWLLRVLGWAASLAGRVWRGLLAAIKRLFPQRGEGPSAAAALAGEVFDDPLFDPFDDPETLAGLSPRELVIRTYHLVLVFAEMMGHGRSLGATPFEYAHQLRRAAPKASDSVASLTWAYAGAMYGGEHFSPPQASAVRESWKRISAALTADVSPEDVALRRRAYLAARQLDRAG